MGSLSITRGTTEACQNVSTEFSSEFYTCQNFGTFGGRTTERDGVGDEAAPSVVRAPSRHPQVLLEWVTLEERVA